MMLRASVVGRTEEGRFQARGYKNIFGGPGKCAMLIKRVVETIEIYIGDPKGHLLQALRNAMLHEGFRATADFGKIEEVLEALNHQCPDVLVLDTGLEDGDVCDVIKKIRNHENWRQSIRFL